MIELKIQISDIDFASIVNAIGTDHLPAAARGAAALATKAVPQSLKEEAAVKLLNGSADKLIAAAQNALENNNIHAVISGAQAAVLK